MPAACTICGGAPHGDAMCAAQQAADCSGCGQTVYPLQPTGQLLACPTGRVNHIISNPRPAIEREWRAHVAIHQPQHEKGRKTK